MQQNRTELSSKIRSLTFKFAAVGWVVAAVMTGMMAGGPHGTHSLFYSLKAFAISAGYMAAISLIPLMASTSLASRWMSWILTSEEQALSLPGKIYYGALLTILISVGGAGFLVVIGYGTYSGLFDIINGRKLMTSSISNIALMFFLGAAYPLVLGAWLEIPMLFLYSHLIKKLVRDHGKSKLETL